MSLLFRLHYIFCAAVCCLLSALALSGCSYEGAAEDAAASAVECPVSIKSRAADFAVLYRDSDTQYEWGGQDPLRSIKIDCSGLVVMCYTYAVADTAYSLPFYDAASASLYADYTKPTDTPERGDLVFLANDGVNADHVGIFMRFEDEKVYFIDSTFKEHSIDGVSERFYDKTYEKIIGYGILLLNE